jgi:hypothetical protein
MITIPDEPVDRFTVVYYSLGYEDIFMHTATYYANETWAKLFPPDGRPAGAPFVDQWYITSVLGRGRIDGWANLRNLNDKDQDRYFTSRDDAVAALTARLTQQIARLEADIQRFKDKIRSRWRTE